MSCKISIIKLIAIAAVMLSGCTNDSDVLPEGEGGTMTFQLSTRAGNGIGERQQVRLFVAERAQEHSGYPEIEPDDDDVNEFHPYVPDGEDPYKIYGQPEEDLHVVETIDLGGSSYQVTGLYGQWYKFAFVCTPKVGGELFGPETEPNKEPNHDFGKCYIDYKPVLDYQSNLNDVKGEDLAIYRKVIDRWADASSPLTEDVTLTRQTGELVLNMGIPEDQFDGKVDHFVITLQTRTQMYVRDMARDSVLIVKVPIENYEFTKFTWNVANQSKEQEIHISLLPDVKPGFDSEGFIQYQNSLNNDTLNKLISRVKDLNREIALDKSLGKGFCIGHSYFCGRDVCTDEWLHSIVDYDILPMLSEYWFDDVNKLQRWENILQGVFQ